MTRKDHPETNPPTSLGRRIADGIGELAWYGAACALLAVLIYAGEGKDIVRDGGLPLLPLIGVYAAITVVCGALLGLLRPMAKGAVGTGVVSMIVALPAMVAVMWFASDRSVHGIGVVDFGIALVLAAIVGPLSVAYARLRQGGRAPDR